MGITEILRRIWLFSANKKKSTESFSKQPTHIIVDLNSSLRHIIVTKKYSGKPCRGLLWLIIMCLHDSSKLYSARQNCAVRNIYNRRAKHKMKNMLKTCWKHSRCEIFGFFSSRSLKTREKYISFAQFVYFLRKVCFLINFWMIKFTIMFFLTYKIVIFIIQKLKSKCTSLKTYTNWAKLTEQN